MNWLFHICPDHAAKHLRQNQVYPRHVSPTTVPVPVTASCSTTRRAPSIQAYNMMGNISH